MCVRLRCLIAWKQIAGQRCRWWQRFFATRMDVPSFLFRRKQLLIGCVSPSVFLRLQRNHLLLLLSFLIGVSCLNGLRSQENCACSSASSFEGIITAMRTLFTAIGTSRSEKEVRFHDPRGNHIVSHAGSYFIEGVELGSFSMRCLSRMQNVRKQAMVRPGVFVADDDACAGLASCQSTQTLSHQKRW
jgi:hypothetical protein